MEEKTIRNFLQNYSDKNMARFHMPGHKGGRGFVLSSDWESMDITEIPEADNLLAPEGLLLEAQKRTAARLGATHTFFLTGGSTVGIIATLLSLPSDCQIMVSRDCHKSVISGLALSGLDSIFIDTPYDIENHRQGVLRVCDVQEQGHGRKAGALLVTSPDYWGRCVDLAAFDRYCKENDMVLIVDEAHGAHLPLLGQESAKDHADIWVQSAHKTLGAWSQCAYLHRHNTQKTFMPSKERMQRALQLVHTTSPSYPMLCALEEACQVPTAVWLQHRRNLHRWRETLPPIWKKATAGRKNDLGVSAIDETRLVIDSYQVGIRGQWLVSFLFEERICIEMADEQSVVLITTPFDDSEWYERLAKALNKAQVQGEKTYRHMNRHHGQRKLVQAMSIREASWKEMELVSADKAADRICAQAAGFYPPGYALILPGELITQEMIAIFEEHKRAGGSTFGWPPQCVV